MRHHILLGMGIATFAIAALWASDTRARPTRQVAAVRPTALPTGNPVRGKLLYQSCSGCHSIDENDVGPKHRGVVGRRAASVPGYAYSAALKRSNLTWNQAALDRWLTNPQKLVPGAKMYFSVANAQNRADIIAYLATQR
jgi:cytochrome c